MMLKICKGVFFFMLGGCSFGQSALHFDTVFAGKEFVSGAKYQTKNSEITLSVFKFYVSHFQFFNNGKLAADLPGTYFLVNASDETSKDRQLDIAQNFEFDEIRFMFGIDAKTNENGVGRGDLDPTKNMYWAWQSGYVNCKIEGSFGQKPFEFHLGGFQKPFESAREIRLKAASAQKITIVVDLEKFISEVPKAEIHIMSPGENAVRFSTIATKMFSIR